MERIENYYGISLRKVLKFLNPFKKLLIKTECEVHIFNNIQSIKLLKKFKYDQEYFFYKKFLKELNEGVVWADQDFKSVNHFYNPYKNKGLFGHSNSLNLTQEYYDKAIYYWQLGLKRKAMFFLGACVHIIQDLTVYQHVHIRLLDNHRQYENFVKYTYDLVREYRSDKRPIVLNTPKEYVEFNSRIALRIENKYRKIKNRKLRFYYYTLSSLPLAQTTTAGCLLMFLEDLKNNYKPQVLLN